ncbi:cellulose binding domain-containing protein [Actinospica robiniae]|uniref:cellulose binding domain-containing protein n=1 Tax=Actinospica robiniae TaxID=304901 RepID=UPI000425E680|nr:cellulose binding domain-containing protein [Actinospica robiniae]
MRGRFLAAGVGGLLVAAVAGAPAQAATSPAVSCTYTIEDEWSGGFIAQISIADNGPSAITGWTVRWTFNEYTTGISAWQSNLTAPDGFTAAATNASYNGTIASGAVTSFGWSARAAATSVPTDLTVNGIPC